MNQILPNQISQPNQILQPEEFFAEVRVGDFIVLTPEGIRFFVVDIAEDPYPLAPGQVLVFGAARTRDVRESQPVETVMIHLSRFHVMQLDNLQYRQIDKSWIWAHRSGDLDRHVEIVRLNPGSWLMRRALE